VAEPTGDGETTTGAGAGIETCHEGVDAGAGVTQVNE
jgi:hypothetical protein